MEQAPREEVARLLEELQRGDATAFDSLVRLLYAELREIAHRQRRRWHGDETLDTTALVHETYLKLVDQTRPRWETQAHFLAAASRAMRHILINYSRYRRRKKRGGDGPKVSLDDVSEQLPVDLPISDDDIDMLVALDASLTTLERVNPRESRIVECRFFGGMTIEETAAALGISTATV